MPPHKALQLPSNSVFQLRFGSILASTFGARAASEALPAAAERLIREAARVPGTVSIGGPVEEIDGQLMLRIPLDAGGRELARYARGIGEVKGGFLIVVIQDWLARKLGRFPGSNVIIDNQGGKFNIRGNDSEA